MASHAQKGKDVIASYRSERDNLAWKIYNLLEIKEK
jgi:hypothetical protein